ncbi:P2Y purinoceptor 13-like [Polymixia lowei]
MTSNNTSSLFSECPPFSYHTFNVVVSCLYFLMFPIALLLNGVATWVSLHLRSTSTFIVYLKNLVAADLLMILTIPLMAASALPGAGVQLKMVACRYTNVTFYCCLYTSIALMGLISLDRFFKIVRPCGRLLGQNLVFSYVMSAFVWVVIFGSTAIPTMILTDRYPGNVTGDFCMSLKGPPGLSLHKGVIIFMEALFWFVSMVIVICYMCITSKVLQSFRNSGSNNSQGKKKTKLRVFLVLLVFFVCFGPLHMIRVTFSEHEIHGKPICTQVWLRITNDAALWLSTTNVCLDPLVYMYLCREFKEKLLDMMKVRVICAHLHSGRKEDPSQ